MPRLSRSALAVAAASATMALGPVPVASAAPVMPAQATDDCLAQGKVWLVVQDSSGKMLADTCTDVAASGEKLLTGAGLQFTKDAKGQMICTIAGEPATCPTKFDGNFWHYYTAGKDGKWVFSQVGANESKPKAGTMEGWCYGKECTPGKAGQSAPTPSATPTPAAAPASDDKQSPWAWLLLPLALVALGAWYLSRRNRKPAAAPVQHEAVRHDGGQHDSGAHAAPRDERH